MLCYMQCRAGFKWSSVKWNSISGLNVATWIQDEDGSAASPSLSFSSARFSSPTCCCWKVDLELPAKQPGDIIGWWSCWSTSSSARSISLAIFLPAGPSWTVTLAVMSRTPRPNAPIPGRSGRFGACSGRLGSPEVLITEFLIKSRCHRRKFEFCPQKRGPLLYIASSFLPCFRTSFHLSLSPNEWVTLQ